MYIKEVKKTECYIMGSQLALNFGMRPRTALEDWTKLDIAGEIS